MSSASPAPTSSTWSTASRRCCRELQAALPAAVDVDAAHRPHRDHPRLGRRRRVRAGAGGRAGGAGDLPVPAQPAGDHHPEPVGAALARRHAWRRCISGGFSLNNLSLMALTIATGFVVDDAIVMIENIARYIEEGEHAARRPRCKGSAQIGFTIISLTVSLIAVLIPLLFMGDVVGPPVPRIRDHAGGHHRDLGRGLADAGADAVRQAAAAPADDAEQARFERGSGACSTGSIGRYGRALRWVLDHQPLTLAGRRRHAGADGASSTSSSRRASSRSRTPA